MLKLIFLQIRPPKKKLKHQRAYLNKWKDFFRCLLPFRFISNVLIIRFNISVLNNTHYRTFLIFILEKLYSEVSVNNFASEKVCFIQSHIFLWVFGPRCREKRFIILHKWHGWKFSGKLEVVNNYYMHLWPFDSLRSGLNWSSSSRGPIQSVK